MFNIKDSYGWEDSEDVIRSMFAMIKAREEREKLMTPEEKAERDKRHKEWNEQYNRKRLIQKNICPDCEGHLVRQKKNKDHIRTWKCNSCEKSFIRE